MSLPKASRKLSLLLFVACTLLLAGSGRTTHAAEQAQTTVPVSPRIVEQVDEAKVTKLRGNVSPLLRSSVDKGEVPSSTQIARMRLVLSRSAEQQAALDKYDADLQSKSSPNYHKWLTPEQFGKLYGPADSDIAAVVAWLESRGLKIDEVPAGRTHIIFSGTASQVEAAFRTTIHNFEGAGQQFYSNTSEPSIPSALTPVVMGVAQLNTIRPTPHRIAGRPGTFDPETRKLTPRSEPAAQSVRPELTNGGAFYVTAADAATIYDTPNSFNSAFSSSTSYNGSGVIIGIAGNAAIQSSTVVSYRSRFLGDTSTTKIINTNIDGVIANGDTGEAYIDTELAGALAPGATVHFYTANNLFDATEQAIADNTVDILSVSFGACELQFSTADNASVNSDWQQAATQGIAVTVSTGDNGSAACDATSDPNGNNIPTAQFGLAVNGLASTPYNIAVGGTDFYPLIDSFSTYVSAEPTNDASVFYRTALSYIPESTWNDSSQSNTTISANFPFTGTDANIVAGSGGKSSCSVNTDTSTTTGTCTSGYAKPSWQRGTGVPNDGVRDLPDISLMAGNGADLAAWLVCTDDTFVQGGTTFTQNCVTVNGGFAFGAFGGTSTAAPAFAGILAMVQQKTGGRLGQAAKEIYDLYNGTHASAVFHDATVGNNSVSCLNPSTDCVKNAAGNYFESGYDTTAGYDLGTGLGSVDVQQLISFWGSAIGSGTSTVTVTPSATSVLTSDSVTVTVTVAGTLGVPTGTVTLSGGGFTSSAVTLSAGAATISIPGGKLSAGTDTLTVTYSGDANYASSNGSATITVSTAYSVAATAVTVSKGATTGNVSTITVTPNAAYHGTITLTCSVATISGGTHTPTCTVSAPITVSGGSAPVTGTVTVSTTAASASAIKASLRAGPEPNGWAGLGVVVACLFFVGIPARRRSWKSILGVLIVIGGLGVLSGCGGGGGGGSTPPPPADPGTTSGTYTVTVTASDTIVTSSTTFQLTVQ